MQEPKVDSILEQQNHPSAQLDEFLKALVMVPEKTSLEIGITLNVNGLLVTGFLVSQQTYFESLIQRLSESQTESETKLTLEDFLIQLKEMLLKKSANQEQDFSPFIHLRDAKIYSNPI